MAGALPTGTGRDGEMTSLGGACEIEETQVVQSAKNRNRDSFRVMVFTLGAL